LNQYIQKSSVFLIPLLGFPKQSYYKFSNSYISSNDIHESEGCLIIEYPKIYKNWEDFEFKFLLTNKYFIKFSESESSYFYVFDLRLTYSNDFDNFITGNYSKFHSKTKERIMDYRWLSLDQESKDMLYCWLFPEKEECLDLYSTKLGIDPSILSKVGELCNKPDLIKENLKNNIYDDKIQEVTR
jgi:hypothetical protein